MVSRHMEEYGGGEGLAGKVPPMVSRHMERFTNG